jgi:osmotically-inducible protein OsmY
MHTDRELQEQILTALDQEPDLDVSHIGVTVNNGVATLVGEVATVPQKCIAEETTRHVAGVRALAVDLDVSPGLAAHRSDPALAEAVVSALRRHSAVPPDAIQASVTGGQVTLTGTVTWALQKASAEQAVQWLPGVNGVTNNIVVKPQASVEDVKARITRRFLENAEIDAQNVRVEIRGGAVVLTGTVRSESERAQAEHAVWSAPGVTNLDDRLRVEG